MLNSKFSSVAVIILLGCFIIVFYFMQICPIIADPDYLELQHILVSLKSKESDESYGEE